MKKILAFAGSNSTRSINKQLVEYTSSQFSEFEIDFADLNDFEVPLYSPERESESGIPEKTMLFAEKIDAADGLILSLAEHNGSYSAAFKNHFDWLSRIPNRKIWNDKPMLLMATSPGGRGGKSVLGTALNRFPFDGAKVVASFSLPLFQDHFSSEKGILNETLKPSYLEALTAFKNVL